MILVNPTPLFGEKEDEQPYGDVHVSATLVNSEQLFKQTWANALASNCIKYIKEVFYTTMQMQKMASKWFANDNKLLLDKCSKTPQMGLECV